MLLAAPNTELRGLFVTTAFNTDWPSQPGLDRYMAEDEMRAIIARAQDLNCNAIFLQLRAFGDRIYEEIDPHLTEIEWAVSVNSGQQYPGYDPLAMWIYGCHEAGLEIHGWVNPFRVDIPIRNFPCYDGGDGFLYLDATSQAVQDYVYCVMEDLFYHYNNAPKDGNCIIVDPPQMRQTSTTRSTRPSSVRNFPSVKIQSSARAAATTSTTGTTDEDGLDGVVIDHYLPPPGEGFAAAKAAEPRTAMIRLTTAPKLSKRRDWALREAQKTMPQYPANEVAQPTEAFIQRLYAKAKQHGIRFGVSPKNSQLAQAAVWMQNHWLDYIAPEIYVQSLAQFKTDLNNWTTLNNGPDPKPQIVPVVYTSRVQKGDKTNNIKRWNADDIEQEVDEIQKRKLGHIHYTYHAVRSPEQGGPEVDRNVGNHLKAKHYKDSAAPNWPGTSFAAPGITPDPATGDLTFTVSRKIRKWEYALRDKASGIYRNQQTMRPGHGNILKKEKLVDNNGVYDVDEITVWAVDRDGNISLPAYRSIP
jgi:hypothetical protein